MAELLFSARLFQVALSKRDAENCLKMIVIILAEILFFLFPFYQLAKIKLFTFAVA
jgi:hypothetical protein